MQNSTEVQLAADVLAGHLPESFNPDKTVGLVLGTGLGAAAQAISAECEISFSQIPHFPASGVASHARKFVYGRLEGLSVLAQQGRCHLYEGRSPRQVCMGVRVMGVLGIRRLIMTNAAGALNPLFNTGDLMCIADMINNTGQSPLTGDNCDAWGERFPDMCQTFSEKFQKLAMDCSLEQGVRLERGIYIGVHGPEMETPAETRMYRNWGGDAIGMSTVLEVIAARHMGMEVLGLSILTNKNLPDCMRPASLEDVLMAAGNAAPRLATLLRAICGKLAILD